MKYHYNFKFLLFLYTLDSEKLDECIGLVLQMMYIYFLFFVFLDHFLIE